MSESYAAEERERQPWYRRARVRRIAWRALMIAALLFVGTRLSAPESFELPAGTLRVRATPAIPGGTLTMPLGPLGELSWPTHTAPMNVEARFVIDREASALPNAREFEGIPWAFFRGKIGWLLAFGMLFGALVVHGQRRRLVSAGVGAGVMLVLGLATGAAAVTTFDPAALADPRYRGPIGDAPRILQLIREIDRDFSGAREQLAEVAVGLQRLHADIVAQRTPDPGTTRTEATRVLLISDLQNNPLGLVITQELVERFGIDLILDAGDFTDRGTAVEGELFKAFADVGVPYVIAPGNHEDAAALLRAQQVEGVRVISEEEDIVTIGGVRILGAPDPNAGSIDSNPNNEVAREMIPIGCERLAQRWAAEGPHVVIVHDPRLGECAARLAESVGEPLVYAWGHTHKQALEERGSVLGVSAGTSGANGPKSAVEAPYGFAMIELDAQMLVSEVCLFEFNGLRQARQVNCRFLEPTP